MIQPLTFKIPLKRHLWRRRGNNQQKRDWYKYRKRLKKYLRVARRIAQWVVLPDNKTARITTRRTKELGTIPSAISNQIIRKYKNNPKCHSVNPERVKLIVPSQHTGKYPAIRHDGQTLSIVPIKLSIAWKCPVDYENICQAQVDANHVWITVNVSKEVKEHNYQRVVGVDLNTKGNLATAANYETGEYEFFYRRPQDARKKYTAIRSRFQRQGRLRKVKEMGSKEHRVVNDACHKVSHDILSWAKHRRAHLAMEDLTGIRSVTRRGNKNGNRTINSWPFYKLRIMVEYKCADYGIKTCFVDPRYTSQDCCCCGARWKTITKKYECGDCGSEMHRDHNAAVNIGGRGYQALGLAF